MRTIAVIARKGGSGKSTLAVHLAIAAHLRGFATLIADADPQRSSSDGLKGRRDAGPAVAETTAQGLVGQQMAALRSGADVMVIDTAAGAEDEVAPAIVLADLSLLVIRPTFLDFAAAIRTVEVIRRLGKPGMIVLNQAPPSRAGVEPPAIRKAHEVLRLMRLPVAPAVVRNRSVYQWALEHGCSAEEVDRDPAAAQEIGELWSCVERAAFGKDPVRDRAVYA